MHDSIDVGQCSVDRQHVTGITDDHQIGRDRRVRVASPRERRRGNALVRTDGQYVAPEPAARTRD